LTYSFNHLTIFKINMLRAGAKGMRRHDKWPEIVLSRPGIARACLKIARFNLRIAQHRTGIAQPHPKIARLNLEIASLTPKPRESILPKFASPFSFRSIARPPI